MNRTQTGNYGENAACGFLRALGYEILERRYKRPGGEIDLICKFHESDCITYVFAEVKYRTGASAGSPAEAVTRAKRRRISQTALIYLGENEIDANVRFDVIEVFGHELLEINHIIGAFDYEGSPRYGG